MYTITKTFDFCAAHRLEGHPKCGRLHGHNYTVTVRISTSRTKEGMVFDYNDLAAVMKPLIEEIDHKYIISNTNLLAEDPYAEMALSKEHGFLLDEYASTAECIARYFTTTLAKMIDGKISVTVSETPKTSATYEDPHDS